MDRSDRSTFWLEGYSDRNKPNADRHDMQNVNKQTFRSLVGLRLVPGLRLLLTATAHCFGVGLACAEALSVRSFRLFSASRSLMSA